MAEIRYLVDDVSTSIAFYCEHLGFELIEQFGPAMAILAKDDLKLWLAGPMASARKPMSDGTKPEPGGWARFVLRVDNLATKVDAMRESGCQFRNEIVEGPGGSQILCLDPSGNVVELFQSR
jgi:catechol 2,3-dioxygenase-like lactoylglutathione lyase family enzyme